MTQVVRPAPNFKLYLGARITSLTGDAMVPVALTIGMDDAGFDAAQITFVLGAWAVALILGILVAGVLADRYGARRMMVLADAVRCLLQLALAMSFAIGSPSILAIAGVQFLSGGATALFQPGIVSLVPRIATDVQRANGVLRGAESGAWFVGPFLAGALLAVSGPGLVFALYAGTYAVSAVCLLALRLDDTPVGGESPILTELTEGWHEFRARDWLWTVIGLNLGYSLFLVGMSQAVVGELVFEDNNGATSFLAGFAAFGAGGVAGAVAAIKVRPSRPLVVGSVGWLMYAAYPLAAGLQFGPVSLALAWLVAGAGLAFWSVLWATTLQTQIPVDLLHRIYAYDVTASLVAMAIGRTLAGGFAAAIGPEQLMVSAALLGATCAVLVFVLPATRALVVSR